jgi:hypothetical protein
MGEHLSNAAVEVQQTSTAVIAEPPLIPSSERFLTEPVK